MNNDDRHIIYFIGIGGIGMSALARYCLGKGFTVCGYDKTASPLTRKLEKEGMKIHYTDSPELVPEKPEMVVYTPAVPADLEEMKLVKEKGFRLMKRAEMLGMISMLHKTIAIAGTHGKTSTTALVAHILKSSRRRMSAFIGGISKNIGSNVVIGGEDDEFVVTEADEFDRSFLRLSPFVSVITSVDADHLDIYGNKENLIEGFNEFVAKTDKKGLVVMHEGLPLKHTENTVTYGFDSADVNACDIRIENGMTHFTIVFSNGEREDFAMRLFGDHNVLNATAAIIISRFIGLKIKDIREALSTFEGVARRFDIQFQDEKSCYIDDYAHHPSEIKASLDTARKIFPEREMTVVFQPHLFTRTRDFMDDFANVLSLADNIILLDIYPAREKPIEGITSQRLLEKINCAKKQVCTKEKLVETIAALRPALLLTMGAGDIDRFVPEITKIFNEISTEDDRK